MSETFVIVDRHQSTDTVSDILLLVEQSMTKRFAQSLANDSPYPNIAQSVMMKALVDNSEGSWLTSTGITNSLRNMVKEAITSSSCVKTVKDAVVGL